MLPSRNVQRVSGTSFQPQYPFPPERVRSYCRSFWIRIQETRSARIRIRLTFCYLVFLEVVHGENRYLGFSLKRLSITGKFVIASIFFGLLYAGSLLAGDIQNCVCCGTVMIYWGSGNPVPIPTLEKFRFRFRIQIGNRIQTVFETVNKYWYLLKENGAFLLLKAKSCGFASGSTTLISTGGLFFCVYNFFILDLTGGSSPCYDLHLVLLFLRGNKYYFKHFSFSDFSDFCLMLFLSVLQGQYQSIGAGRSKKEAK